MMNATEESLKFFCDGAEAELVVQKGDNIIFEMLEDGSMILFNETTQETHLLNATAGLIFKLCDGRVVSDIYVNFKGQIDDFKIIEEKIQNDFYRTIEELANKNILRIIQ